MAYKISDNDVIKAANIAVFKNVIVGVHEDFAPLSPVQGETSGYSSGGEQIPGPPYYVNTIDKFPFSSDTNASDVGDLTQARGRAGGQSSSASGYSSGGVPNLNTIDKFPFSSDANATDVGDLLTAQDYLAGNSSENSGYSSGGRSPLSNVIQKFPFSSDANTTDVGDLTQARFGADGQSSPSNGYVSGGGTSPPFTDVNPIDKFPFASDANATDVGDLSEARGYVAGQSSTASGYTSGGPATSPNTSRSLIIDKFPFASDANATDVGDLSEGRKAVTGQSSASSGYTSGGRGSFPTLPGQARLTIDKFPFSSDGNATDVGNLILARNDAAGQQV